MKYPYRNRVRRYFHVMLYLILASVVMLWSWNVLAELFSWPQAQYRHALAATLPIILFFWTLRTGSRRHKYATK